MALVANHPEKNVIRAQLRQNVALKRMTANGMDLLERNLIVVDCAKGECLLCRDDHEMAQYFVLDGILKRVVTNREAKEMIPRFAAERDIEAGYATWPLRTAAPYGIIAVTKVRVAKLPLVQWVAFMGDQPHVKQDFEYEVMRLMSEITAHSITLHLLDAPGRVHECRCKHPDIVDRLPKKELASYLNLCAETLSRVQHGERFTSVRASQRLSPSGR